MQQCHTAYKRSFGGELKLNFIFHPSYIVVDCVALVVMVSHQQKKWEKFQYNFNFFFNGSNYLFDIQKKLQAKRKIKLNDAALSLFYTQYKIRNKIDFSISLFRKQIGSARDKRIVPAVNSYYSSGSLKGDLDSTDSAVCV